MPPETPPKKRGRPSEGARDAILAATRELLDERGLARLTTNEVARRAGVSEASIFYHFGDRAGLVGAALEANLDSLRDFAGGLAARAGLGELEQTLTEVSRRWERFFDRVLPLIGAVQADADLRAEFREHLRAQGYGPHRGVDLLARYLEAEQGEGRIRDDVEAPAAAMLLLGAAFMRALQRATIGPRAMARLPTPEQTVSEFVRAFGAPPAGHVRAGGRRRSES
jgi:AcrR family transcriptional regulator